MHPSAINLVLSLIVALVLHELGHLFAARLTGVAVTEAGLGWGPKLTSIRVRAIDYSIRLLPLGAYVRLDMVGLRKHPLGQQLFVMLAGIAVNLILAVVGWGTFFGSLNLILAIANLVPLYQQDGWKSGMLIFRHLFQRSSPVVEWTFTIAGGTLGLALAARVAFGL